MSDVPGAPVGTILRSPQFKLVSYIKVSINHQFTPACASSQNHRNSSFPASPCLKILEKRGNGYSEQYNSAVRLDLAAAFLEAMQARHLDLVSYFWSLEVLSYQTLCSMVRFMFPIFGLSHLANINLQSTVVTELSNTLE